jgi:hypothetical protein
MGVMCVNFKKAFDSVEHVAIEKTLRFFNFGEVMIKMVMTLLNGRSAGIILGNGYSKTFNIERGTPQGDRSSPYLFIICMEILLIKIRSMQGGGIDCCNFILRTIGGIDVEAVTAEAYADDLTILFKMSDNSVRVILEVLENFYRTTGLEVNTEKTQLMITGTNEWGIGRAVHGIMVVESVKILGIKIDRNLMDLDNNWETIITNMTSIATYWGLFGLSIMGRVMVAKTYIISQALYVMGLLPLSDILVSRLNEIIVRYIAGSGRPIERWRQLLPADAGGYGMIDMRVMNVCLKSLWISRLTDEHGKLDYMSVVMLDGNNLEGREVDYERIGNHIRQGEGGVIIEDILHRWRDFKDEFYRVEENMLRAKLFDNECVKADNVKTEDFVFGNRFVDLRDTISGKTVGDYLDGANRIKSKIEIENTQNIRINWAEYFRLRQAIGGLVTEIIFTGNGGITLSEFMGRGKNKCRKFRTVFDGKKGRIYRDNNPSRIASLRTLWGDRINMKERKYIEWNLSIWTISVLDSGFKDFCFKLLHGRLYFNLALSHFADIRPGCTFCCIKKKNTLENMGIAEGTPQYAREIEHIEGETIVHLLWECEFTHKVVKLVFNKIAGTREVNVCKQKYFEGGEVAVKDENKVLIILCRYIQYVTNKCRERRQMPTFTFVYEEVQGLLQVLGTREKWRSILRRLDVVVRNVLEDV